MITLPPRHGKSTLLSHYFPAWYLGIKPDKRVVLTSYQAKYAQTWGRKCRDCVNRWGYRFGVQVRKDSRAADHWDLFGHTGGMNTAGVDGAITGRGADVLLIDDPVKNAREALSPAIRAATIDWFNSTAYTRLEPGGAIVLIQTRWHTGDLTGHVLSSMSGDQEPWVVVNLPAIAGDNDPLGRAPGEALWPERYPLKVLNDIRSVLGSRWFSSLYQQQPINAEGALILRGWFEVIEATPAALKTVRFWDLAATEPRDHSDPDYTCGAKLSHDKGTTFVTDIVRARVTPLKVEQLVLNTAKQDGRTVEIAIEQEGGASGKSLIAHYTRLLQGYKVKGVPPRGDKVLRASPFIAQAEAGNVKLLRGGWNKEFLDEAESFPLGDHDDQIDAVVGAYTELVAGRPLLDLY